MVKVLLTSRTRTTFHGYGLVNLTLGCTETEYQNPNWTMGETYSSRTRDCTTPDVQLPAYQMSAVA